MPLTLKDASGADVQVPTAEEISEMITGAVRSHVDKANKKLGADLMKEVTDTVKGSFAEFEKKLPPPVNDPNQPTQRDDPAMADLRKRLEDAEKVLVAERDARVKAETTSRDNSTRTTLGGLLSPAIRPEAVKLVVESLFRDNVDYDEQNTPLFKLRKAAALGLPEEEIRLPLDAGIREWLKSKDNEWLIPTRPPTAQQRPGARMPQGPLATQLPKYDQPATSEDEKIRRAMEREQVLKAQGIGG